MIWGLFIAVAVLLIINIRILHLIIKPPLYDWKMPKAPLPVFTKIIVAILLLICFATVGLFVLLEPLDANEHPYPNEFGDAFGGILNPLVAILAAFLTFLAFWIQYEANKLQRNAQDQQREDIKRERFENRFYEMLRLHRANVSEMSIVGRIPIEGRKIFTRMFYEILFVYHAVQEVNNYNNYIKTNNQELRIVNLAYRIFFHGIGNASNNSLEELLKDENDSYKLYMEVRPELQKIQRKYIADKSDGPFVVVLSKGQLFWNLLERKENPDRKGAFESTVEFWHRPFDGHESRLGHYYRHLYQTVKFITDPKNILGNDCERYRHVKVIRAQLSNFEQLMLYCNSFAYGKEWVTDRIFSDWCMIKNMSLELAKQIYDPYERLKEYCDQDEEEHLLSKLDLEKGKRKYVFGRYEN